jgi:hypothetical protein
MGVKDVLDIAHRGMQFVPVIKRGTHVLSTKSAAFADSLNRRS